MWRVTDLRLLERPRSKTRETRRSRQSSRCWAPNTSTRPRPAEAEDRTPRRLRICRLPICTNCTVSGSTSTSMGLLGWTSRPRRPPGWGRQSEQTSRAKNPGSPISLRGPSSPELTVWVPPPRRPRGRLASLASLARARTSQSSISSRSTKIASSLTTARTRQKISPETSTYVDAFV